MALVGVYSYPKSGNTWVRGIIAAAMNASAKVIPDLHEARLSEAREFRGFRFFKHHGGRDVQKWQGQDVQATHIIHIRRNPLDVFMSYLNFISANVTNTASIPFESVESIAGTDLLDLYFSAFLVAGHIAPTFSVETGDYFSHNHYWMNFDQKPIARIRYEDLLNDPINTLSFLKTWLKLTDDDLDKMLQRAGVGTRKDGKFYWRQEEKNYFNFLSEEQVATFVKYRGDQCRALGYEPEYLLTPPNR
ncbi:MAG: sulfotransferase domain-containing protein [Candidatus Hydrogenedentes bacterium]|nr:sulfotransferase domain-containing protein [Candidatus Hydrogenedentota bacterium]